MNWIQSAIALLGRPVPDTSAPRGGGARRRSQVDPGNLLAEPEISEHLAGLAERYAECQLTVTTAGDELDRLSTGGHSFAKVRELHDRIDEAQHDLGQVARFRPELESRLRQLQFQRKSEEWLVVRDAAAAFCREELLPALAAYKKAQSAWRARYATVLEEFPLAGEILPRLPSLNEGGVDFAATVDTFAAAVMQRDTPPPPPMVMFSLAGVIEHARRTGDIPGGIPPDWRDEVERALSGVAKVKMIVATLDAHGRSVAAGTVLTVPYDDASRYVSSGRAVYD